MSYFVIGGGSESGNAFELEHLPQDRRLIKVEFFTTPEKRSDIDLLVKVGYYNIDGNVDEDGKFITVFEDRVGIENNFIVHPNVFVGKNDRIILVIEKDDDTFVTGSFVPYFSEDKEETSIQVI